MMQIKKHQGFSLVEVVVATIIFLIAALGIFGIFTAAQNLSANSNEEIIAANYGRELLEKLRANVDWRTWGPPGPGTWPLTCDGAPNTWAPPLPMPGPNDAFSSLTGGAVNYTCFEDPNIFNIRKVTLVITWQ